MDLFLCYLLPAPKFVAVTIIGTLISLLAIGMVMLMIIFYRIRVRSQKLERTVATLQAQENLRRDLAAELHSGLGQRLAAAKSLAADHLYQAELSGAPTATFRDLKALLGDCITETRALTQATYGGTLLEQGLLPAIDTAITLLRMQLSIKVHARLPQKEPPLSADSQLALYRIFQDLLGNIRRHAQATAVEIDMDVRDGFVHLSIRDNGIGFDVGNLQRQTGLGLYVLRQRIDEMGGVLSIRSEPGNGTNIHLRIPISQT